VSLLGLPRGDWRLILAGAILTALAYPPFHLFVPSFLALVPAVWLIAGAPDAPVRRWLLQGVWYGLLGHGLVLYWMVIALWHFTKLSVLGYLATIGVLALYAGVVFALAGWIVRRTRLSLVWVFPVLWTAADWLIGHQGDVRFPWLGLGTSLTGFPTVVQIADLIGARGVTFALALANGALAHAWLIRADRRRAVAGVAWVAVGVAAAWAYGTVRERTLPLRAVGTVAVIQPNVGFSEKWDGRPADRIVSDALALAERGANAGASLVVWPEAAIPGTFQGRPAWSARIGALAAQYGTPMVVGALDIEARSRTDYDWFNAAFLFDSAGVRDARVYRKRYLVPITERVPFLPPEWFGDLEFFGGATPGTNGPVYDIAAGRFGVLICYESVFENLTRQYRRDGADFLLNITNDAWFGRSSAPYQHAAHLVMRAIESRTGVARAANTGISAFVDPLGRVHQSTALFVETVERRVLTTTDVIPPYVRWGDWVGLGSLAASLLLVGVARWRR
jgi:apolipoprotein N-acyltransferase